MEFNWHDALGGIGVALILLAYGLLQLGRLRSEALMYSVLNWVGPALVLISLSREFNLAAAALEAAWMSIATIGIAKWVLRRRAGANLDHS